MDLREALPPKPQTPYTLNSKDTNSPEPQTVFFSSLPFDSSERQPLPLSDSKGGCRADTDTRIPKQIVHVNFRAESRHSGVSVQRLGCCGFSNVAWIVLERDTPFPR